MMRISLLLAFLCSLFLSSRTLEAQENPELCGTTSFSEILKLSGAFSLYSDDDVHPYLASPQNQTLVFFIKPNGAVDEYGDPLTFDAIKMVAQRAIAEWNNVPNSYVTFSIADQPFPSDQTPEKGDGISTIYFGSLTANGLLAGWEFDSEGRIKEADIVLNSGRDLRRNGQWSFYPLRWNTHLHYPEEYELYQDPYAPSAASPDPLPSYIGPVDMQDVLTHELGHALGLGHVHAPFTYNTMYPTYYSEENWWEKTYRRTLEDGDKAGKVYQCPSFSTASTQTVPHILLSSKSTIDVSGSFTVPSGDTLEIEPGITLRFASGTSITSYGNFKAIGTASPIIFTSQSGAAPGSWGGLIFSGSGAYLSELDNVTMEYGGEMQCLSGAHIIVQNSTLRDNINGVYFYDASPWILGNQISNIQNYGIIGITNGGQPSIYENIISTVSTGIALSGTNGYIDHNQIDDYGVGFWASSGSSPQFYHGNGVTRSPNNRIRYGATGIEASDGSYPVLGDPDNNGSYNSIYYNEALDAVATGLSFIWAGLNYWGGGGPNIWYDAGSYISADACLTSDPWDGYSSPIVLHKKRSLSANSATSTIQASTLPSQSVLPDSIKAAMEVGLRYRKERKINAGIEHFKQMYSSNKAPRFALSQISAIDADSLSAGALSFMESLKGVKSDDQPAVMTILSGMYMRRGRVAEARSLLEEIHYPDTWYERHALLRKFYLALYYDRDRESASEVLSAMETKYNRDKDVNFARYILNAAGTSAVISSNPQKPAQLLRNQKKTRHVEGDFALLSNYPNPFNPTTRIDFQIPFPGRITLKVYDILGKEVMTLVDEYRTEGRHTVSFDASPLSSGVYFYRLQAGNIVETKKLQVVR